MAVPFGIGYKLNVSNWIGLGLEWAPRKTFTDYLDDVSSTYVGIDKFSLKPKDPSRALQDRSVELNPNNALGRTGKQRGNSATRDQYLMCLFSVSWHFTTYRCPNYMDKELISTY